MACPATTSTSSTSTTPASLLVVRRQRHLIAGTRHPTGARCRWNAGETMLLGAALDDQPVCTLELARQAQG
jgi:hypothetical protein